MNRLDEFKKANGVEYLVEFWCICYLDRIALLDATKATAYDRLAIIFKRFEEQIQSSADKKFQIRTSNTHIRTCEEIILELFQCDPFLGGLWPIEIEQLKLKTSRGASRLGMNWTTFAQDGARWIEEYLRSINHSVVQNVSIDDPLNDAE